MVVKIIEGRRGSRKSIPMKREKKEHSNENGEKSSGIRPHHLNNSKWSPCEH